MRRAWALVACLVLGCSGGGGADAGTDPGTDTDTDTGTGTDHGTEEGADLASELPPDVPIEILPPDKPLCEAPGAGPSTKILVDPAGPGRRFDGLGAISSSGNSRLLIDYPEPQRSTILDLLFRPRAGASFQVLKVEIPGDMNSTSGAEASHRHVAGETDCGRGYEWWLMKEAKARNPAIQLQALAWGSPGWTGVNGIYSPELIDYLLSWLECAEQNGLHVEWLGGRNETAWDGAWIRALREALDARGLDTKLVMADTHATFGWLFATALVEDPELAEIVDAVGVHYVCAADGTIPTACVAPPEAIDLGLPLWASEIQASGPAEWGRILTRGYVEGRMVAYQNWPLISASPPGVPGGDIGFAVANQPWSGAFRIVPDTWAFAHLSWFTDLGWRYLDEASGHLGGDRAEGAYVTLVSPDGTHATILVDTSTATKDHVVEVAPADGMPKRVLHAWTSDATSGERAAWLVHDCDLDPAAGPVRLLVPPGRLVTLSTTTDAAPADFPSPASAPFPLPYRNDFEDGTPGMEGRWMASAAGAFEVRPCGGGRAGTCVRQSAIGTPVYWGPQQIEPLALIGDASLADVVVTVAAMPEADGAVEVHGRYFNQPWFKPKQHEGYRLRVATDGAWSLTVHSPDSEDVRVLASGQAAAWAPGTWKTLSLSLAGPEIRASLDGAELGGVTDGTWIRGLAGIGLSGDASPHGWFPAQFDDLGITAATPSPR